MEESRGKKRFLILVILLVVILFVAAIAYKTLSGRQKLDLTAAKPAVETDLPDFPLIDESDGETSLHEIIAEGKPILINFWATWCPFCVEEFPMLDRAYEEYGEDVRFLIVDAVDGERETKEMGKAYVEENGYHFPIYFDMDYAGMSAFGTTSLPTTIAINAKGELVLTRKGALTEEVLDEILKQITEA